MQCSHAIIDAAARSLGARISDTTAQRSSGQPKDLPLRSRAERGDERRHASMSFQAAEVFHGFEDTGRDPVQHHLSAAPAPDVPLHMTCATEQTLGGVRRRQRAAQARREVQREDGQRLVETFADALRRAGIFGFEATGEIE
jgi:hypothetical protein